ncbi:glycosyltransferase [Streptomyces sp. NPDC090741]|uniref:glycosyltransferase n=1 Tax=Streptomyces sp. NPDC090741 TaxID=3365967 RepID=UPI0038067C51
MGCPRLARNAPGGIATYSRLLAGQAARLGHDVTVFVITGGPAQARTPPFTGGIRVVEVPYPGPSPWACAEAFRDAVRRHHGRGHQLDRIEAADFLGRAGLLDRTVPLTTRLHVPSSCDGATRTTRPAPTQTRQPGSNTSRRPAPAW